MPTTPPSSCLTTDLTTDSRQFSQELQFQLGFDTVNAILGGYYFNEATDERLTVFLPFPPSPPDHRLAARRRTGLARPAGLGPRDRLARRLRPGLGQADRPARAERAALRYTEDRKTYQGTVLNLFPSTQPDPDPLPTLAIPEGGPLFIFNRPFEDTFSALTGSASVQYRWSRLAQHVRFLRAQLQVGRLQHPLQRAAAGQRARALRRGDRRQLRAGRQVRPRRATSG